jgi:hypothetical protein
VSPEITDSQTPGSLNRHPLICCTAPWAPTLPFPTPAHSPQADEQAPSVHIDRNTLQLCLLTRGYLAESGCIGVRGPASSDGMTPRHTM